jgi:hypothetical protein
VVRKFHIAIFAAVTALLPGECAHAVGTMTQQEFFAQYEPAVEKLRRFYTHMTLEATVTKRAVETNKPVIERQRIVVQTDGDKMRVETFVPSGAGGESVRVSVASPGSSFGARREPGQERFVLYFLSSDGDDNLKKLDSRHYYVFAPFRENMLLNKFRAKGTRITSIEQEERNGEVLVKVAYDCDIHYDNKSSTFSGYDVLSKTMCWALRESVAGEGEVQQRAVIEYDGVIDGVPLLKSAEYWRQRGDRRVNIVRCEVTEIVPDVAPAEMFEVSSVVPDLRQERKSFYWLLLIAGGVVLIAIAVVVARFAAHRRAAA